MYKSTILTRWLIDNFLKYSQNWVVYKINGVILYIVPHHHISYRFVDFHHPDGNNFAQKWGGLYWDMYNTLQPHATLFQFLTVYIGSSVTSILPSRRRSAVKRRSPLVNEIRAPSHTYHRTQYIANTTICGYPVSRNIFVICTLIYHYEDCIRSERDRVLLMNM